MIVSLFPPATSMSEALPMMKDLEQSCSSAKLGRDGIEQVSKSLEVVSMSTDALVSHVLFPQKTRCVGQLGRWIFGIPYAMLFFSSAITDYVVHVQFEVLLADMGCPSHCVASASHLVTTVHSWSIFCCLAWARLMILGPKAIQSQDVSSN